MPFFVAALAILYYLPYIAFRTLNKDKQSLKDEMKKDGRTAQSIVENHFRNFQVIISLGRMKYYFFKQFGAF